MTNTNSSESLPASKSEDNSESGQNIFRNKFRFFILILGTLCLTSVFSNMITLNFTIICMDPNKAIEIVGNNDSKAIDYPTYEYTQYEKTVLQWAVSISSMLATFPFSWMCSQYGARYVFFVSGVLSALSTGLIPAAAALGFGWFIVVRVIQGFAYACDFAVIGVLCTRWASLKENAKFIGVLTCFSPLSSFLTNSVSGVICETIGWTWVHYLHALVSLVLFTAWIIFYTDDPMDNCLVSAKEISTIHKNKSEAHKVHERFVPYLPRTRWYGQIADLFSGFFLFIYAPTYIKKVLKYSTTETGILGALGAISHIPVKMTCGYISDSYHCMPERKKMWIFNSVAVLTPALIYVYLCYAPADMPLVTVILFGGVHAALGFNCGGFYKCGALVSRQYAEFVIAFTQFIKCCVFFVAPALVAVFVDDDSNAGQWHTIFFIIAGTLVFANTVFCVYATDKPSEFTKITAATAKRRPSNE